MFESIRKQTESILLELLGSAGMNSNDLLVVGCSTSEIAGQNIGKCSSPAIAEIVFQTIHGILLERNIFLAAQCCEHLNRALVLERQAAQHYGYDLVSVVPKPTAGGSFAAAAYEQFCDPVVVESIRAHAGIDIGLTLIGMHLKPVAVPVRTEIKCIGSAHVVCARTRPKYIGGSRAMYV